jgi:hypothetical protein
VHRLPRSAVYVGFECYLLLGALGDNYPAVRRFTAQPEKYLNG